MLPNLPRNEMSPLAPLIGHYELGHGGDLSSDVGFLLLKEFFCKIGAVTLVKRLSQTNDSAWYRIHKDDDNLRQVIYQIMVTYFEDDCADELTNEPVMGAVFEKKSPRLTANPFPGALTAWMKLLWNSLTRSCGDCAKWSILLKNPNLCF